MANKPNPSPVILKNGNRHSSVYWAELSDEEKEIKKAIKKERANMTRKNNKMLKTLRESLDAIWQVNPEFLATLNNMTVVQMNKAMTGDTQAYQAVMTYTAGRPVERQQITQDTNVSFNPLQGIDDEEFEIILNKHLRNDE